MFRQAARPLARQPLSTLALSRAFSNIKAPAARPQAQALLDARTKPQMSIALVQNGLLKRQFVTSEKRADKQVDQQEKAIERQSSVDFQHTTSGAREEVRDLVTE
jgi:hypothetical protein